MMKRRVVDRNLHLGRRELSLSRSCTEVPCRERLACPVFTSNPLREPLATGDEVELLVDSLDQRVEAGGKVLEALIRHEPAAKGVHDRRGFGNNRHQLPS